VGLADGFAVAFVVGVAVAEVGTTKDGLGVAVGDKAPRLAQADVDELAPVEEPPPSGAFPQPATANTSAVITTAWCRFEVAPRPTILGLDAEPGAFAARPVDALG
jgi:hypothetical protein